VSFEIVCDLVDVDMFEYLLDGFRHVLGDWQDVGDGGMCDRPFGEDVGRDGGPFIGCVEGV
jgi:hypothetical protein